MYLGVMTSLALVLRMAFDNEIKLVSSRISLGEPRFFGNFKSMAKFPEFGPLFSS